MAIYKCADEACTTVYEFQRTQAKPLGERVRHLLEVSNSNDINGIGDAFIALIQPTRLVIDGGGRIRSPLAYQPPHSCGQGPGKTSPLFLNAGFSPEADWAVQRFWPILQFWSRSYISEGYTDLAHQIQNIVRLGERSPRFQRQFIQLFKEYLDMNGPIASIIGFYRTGPLTISPPSTKHLWRNF